MNLPEGDAEPMFHLTAQRQSIGTDLHSGAAQGIRGLIRVSALNATPAPLTLSYVDVKAGGDRLYGRDIRLILGNDPDLLDAPSTLRTDFKRQGHIFHTIHLLWNGPKRGRMPRLTTGRLGVLFGIPFGEGRGLALVAAAYLFYLTAQFLYGHLQLCDPSL
jgi:hypothetical protein